MIDFGVGDPREVTPAFIRARPRGCRGPRLLLPTRARPCRAAWRHRRMGRAPLRRPGWIPTPRSCRCSDRRSWCSRWRKRCWIRRPAKDLVIVDGRPDTRSRNGARGSQVAVSCGCPLTRGPGFLPDLDGVDEEAWDRAALALAQLPEQPDRRRGSLDFLREAAGCRAHEVLLASDEAYSELWFEGGRRRACCSFGRSAGCRGPQHPQQALVDDGVSQRVRRGRPRVDRRRSSALRPSVGVTPQEFVQRASVAAWNDEAHVEDEPCAVRRQAGDLPRPVPTARDPGRRLGRDLLPVGRSPGGP